MHTAYGRHRRPALHKIWVKIGRKDARQGGVGAYFAEELHLIYVQYNFCGENPSFGLNSIIVNSGKIHFHFVCMGIGE